MTRSGMPSNVGDGIRKPRCSVRNVTLPRTCRFGTSSNPSLMFTTLAAIVTLTHTDTGPEPTRRSLSGVEAFRDVVGDEKVHRCGDLDVVLVSSDDLHRMTRVLGDEIGIVADARV